METVKKAEEDAQKARDEAKYAAQDVSSAVAKQKAEVEAKKGAEDAKNAEARSKWDCELYGSNRFDLQSLYDSLTLHPQAPAYLPPVPVPALVLSRSRW